MYPLRSKIICDCLIWGLILSAAMLRIRNAKILVKTQMQSTLAKQYQHRLAKGGQQLTHVECGLRGFVAKAGW